MADLTKAKNLVLNPQKGFVYRIVGIHPDSGWAHLEPRLKGKLCLMQEISMTPLDDKYASGVSGLVEALEVSPNREEQSFFFYGIALKKIDDFTEANFLCKLRKKGIIPWAA
jgi:hypothetical protein